MRVDTAMSETIAKQEYRSFQRSTETSQDTVGRSNSSRARALKEDRACLVRSAQTITPFQLEVANEKMLRSTGNEESVLQQTGIAGDVEKCVGKGEISTFIKHLYD